MKSAQIAFIRYSYGEQIIYLVIFINDKETTRLSQEDTGTYLYNIQSEIMSEISSSLWEIYEEGDEQPTYSLKWNYKNVYYEFLGKINKEEMEKIAKEIIIKFRRRKMRNEKDNLFIF